MKEFMVNDLIHRIDIAVPAETIYRALTTEEASARGGKQIERSNVLAVEQPNN